MVERPSVMPRARSPPPDSGVSPRGVRSGHLDDELFEFGGGPSTAGFTRLGGVLGGDEPAVPRQQGIGRHEGLELGERLAAEDFGLLSQTDSLGVSEARFATAELFKEDSVFGAQVVDESAMVPVDGKGEGQQEEAKQSVQGEIVRPAMRANFAARAYRWGDLREEPGLSEDSWARSESRVRRGFCSLAAYAPGARKGSYWARF